MLVPYLAWKSAVFLTMTADSPASEDGRIGEGEGDASGEGIAGDIERRGSGIGELEEFSFAIRSCGMVVELSEVEGSMGSGTDEDGFGEGGPVVALLNPGEGAGGFREGDGTGVGEATAIGGVDAIEGKVEGAGGVWICK